MLRHGYLTTIFEDALRGPYIDPMDKSRKPLRRRYNLTRGRDNEEVRFDVNVAQRARGVNTFVHQSEDP